MSTGQIKQAIFLTLEDICHKRKIMHQYLKGDSCLNQSCKKPEVETKGKCISCKNPRCKFKKIKVFSSKSPPFKKKW